MDQKEKREWILSTLRAGTFWNVSDAMKTVGGAIDSLEKVPAGLRNKPTHIACDLADGKLTAEQSVKELIAFVEQIPD